MAQELAPFVYTPLEAGEIRLLDIYLHSDGTVKCYLRKAPLLDVDGEYDALSYTWGDLSRTHPITCNGRRLEVHHNLFVALPYLARRNSRLPIWIDAVCINQADAAEKMQQIRMMITVFKQASWVWVWLGPGNEQSGNVVSNLTQLVDRETDALTMATTMPETLPWLTTQEAWSTIMSLTDNEWYRRLWVVQEVSYARRLRVLLGQHAIDWDILRRLITSGSDDWHVTGPDGEDSPTTSKWAQNLFQSRDVTQMALKCGRSLNAEGVASIVIYTMRTFCRDPRDRIYALLGFVTIKVEETTPLEDMYIQLTRTVLLNLSLDSAHWWSFLRSATSVGKRSSLPSWCPDFHDCSGRTEINLKVERYSASARRNEAERPYNLHSKELVLRGQIFDSVETAFGSLHVDVENLDPSKVHTFHNWEQATETAIYTVWNSRPRRSFPGLASEAAIAAAYWDTLNSHFAFNYEEWPTFYKSLTSFKEGVASCLHDIDTLRLLEEVAFSLDMVENTEAEFLRLIVAIMPIYNAMKEQRLFMTADGRLGRGPSTIQPGDSICIFSFARTAHILRRSPNTTAETYALIGEAYVHGMMNGEIEDLDIEEQDVVLV
ncbi:heterokaryon incompatibility protein-domain-containing protein [Paraphoma chrysanthemicola]|uniref:Heterokaryon incompatibility protein-domain-containing protein n=1 Tax=Paraphoma chrysanthemicola TaxID=798071 RepID=A0A8K0R7B6_9PLEO|nr:heterokaryon incompatibility protein-domain-containing protein [Paraphoma chrysanthemicola]